MKLVIHNRGKQLGRRGLLVSGASGTGKSTSITQLGKTFQIDLQRRWPANPDRIPVVYIVVPPDAGPKRWPPNWRHFWACRSTPTTAPNTSPTPPPKCCAGWARAWCSSMKSTAST
jgi:hypothetical protein